jgi:acyl-coenzyme A synthetase/AMP-(fatty) acid ligase
VNLAAVLEIHADRQPDHPAIVDGELTLSYREFNETVANAAANIADAGIRPGDLVGVSLPDSARYLVVQFALARCGAIFFAVDADMPVAERQEICTMLGMKAIIADDHRLHETGLAFIDADDVDGKPRRPLEPATLDGSHPLVATQSSGTTGKPKTLIWTHEQMAIQARRHQECLGWTSDDRYLAIVKMRFFWQRELCYVLLSLGATIVVTPPSDVARLIRIVEQDRITILALTPAHLVPLLAYDAPPYPLFAGLKTLLVGSAPLAHERRLAVRRQLTPNFYEQLGTNEAGLLVLGTPEDQDARPAAIGRIASGVEARIVNSAGQPLPPGEVGLVGFRAAGFPTSYVDAPGATKRHFRDNWFYPGDLAAIDAEGFFLFKGRADDVINSAGVKFYPIEVEEALMTHPSVGQVAVFGWPDERVGEVAVACVVKSADVDAAELQAHCRSQLAPYKIPKWIAFVAQLPMTSTGKTIKRELKEALKKTLPA